MAGPKPNPDMPDSVLKDYMEASEIADKSPRAAAALLRLVAEKLCHEVVKDNSKTLDECIDLLVKQGKITDEIRQALDTVRVYGNHSVHLGELSLDDKPDTVNLLFALVNLICNATITQSRMVEEAFPGHPGKGPSQEQQARQQAVISQGEHEMKDGQIMCRNPDCTTQGFWPSWHTDAIQSPNPQRSKTQQKGTAHSTTCPSCGHLHVALSTALGGVYDHNQTLVFPLAEEDAIEVVVWIVVNFYAAQDTEEEKEEKASKLREWLQGLWQTAKDPSKANAAFQLGKGVAKLLGGDSNPS